MFQTFRLLYLFVLFFLQTVLCSDAYVIYTTSDFKESAQLIAKLHHETIPLELGLASLETTISLAVSESASIS